MLGADDALDVFGVHGVGGILGALLTGVFTAPDAGGNGKAVSSIGSQLRIQAEAVLTRSCRRRWSVIAYKFADLVGLRVAEDAEHEGLDIRSHGETAYSA